MDSRTIRRRFLDYFEDKGHAIVPSAPVVVHDDPSLLFINAGMNPFKDVFLGNASPKAPRVADTQKCLRVSGKHNDLEEVGVDHYHHTLFEMLGNWSFDDYFKQDTIDWAWDLLTTVYGLDEDRLYVTVFGGDAADGLDEDTEAADLWAKHVPADRILRCGKADNFWEMGETGPCGPCSEIHIDLRPDAERDVTPGADLVNADHEQVIEIWNLVFIQYQRVADGSLRDLSQRHIDTGMGLEQLVRVLQKTESNYDTDLFRPLIASVEDISGHAYGQDAERDVAFRVIADHVRAVAFTIADGQLPGNTGAGYVIRRILRRAVRYGFSFLGLDEPFLHRLIGLLDEQFHDVFPEVRAQRDFVERVVREEEASFFRTLSSGLGRLGEQLDDLEAGTTLDGRLAFELYDTYGFPVDLTRLIAAERGVRLDEAGFEAARAEQQERSRSAAKQETGDWVELRRDDVQEFVGYDLLEADVRITRHRTVRTASGQEHQVVLTVTPFYAESGGQVGDIGWLRSETEAVRVLDTRTENDLTVHVVDRLPDEPGVIFHATVDADRRSAIRRNHSATHLVHEALREVLGDHVEQRGSLVHPDYLRFDFSHFGKMTDEEVARVEELVNHRILAGLTLEEHRQMPISKAREMGAMALFGEKYGDVVRVVRFGSSVELCGGTHVDNTGQIGLFRITQETSVASGVRRIEAITGKASLRAFRSAEGRIDEALTLLKSNQELTEAVGKVIDERDALQAELDAVARDREASVRSDLQASAQTVDGTTVVVRSVRGLDGGALKNLAFEFKQAHDSLFLALGSDTGEKAVLTIMLTDDLVERGLHAGNLVRELASEIGGGGGGQPFFATAGGTNPSGLDKALAAARAAFDQA